MGVTLPKGFRYVQKKNFVDAWIGIIESDDRKFVIDFAVGMADLDESVSTYKNQKSLIWEKTDQIKVWPDKEPSPYEFRFRK